MCLAEIASTDHLFDISLKYSNYLEVSNSTSKISSHYLGVFPVNFEFQANKRVASLMYFDKIKIVKK